MAARTTVVLRLFAFSSFCSLSRAKVRQPRDGKGETVLVRFELPTRASHHASASVTQSLDCGRNRNVAVCDILLLSNRSLCGGRCPNMRTKMRIFTKDEKRAAKARHGNVPSYEGNICKQVIDALERRLDKWRTVAFLFKRPRTCEWIFCSQKARTSGPRARFPFTTFSSVPDSFAVDHRGEARQSLELCS